ncbi:heat shock 70 kDa protein 12A-like [Mercenaria mercenaria]|uniref:heat shock 70 kDa protein 12A-like n=1 Tax=Mercenaria mercenaria TaxID=6596 RepID=UPI00234F1BC7|nr:heat shock 70 kDa protein 12A-like [Mercenaria mercenaria]
MGTKLDCRFIQAERKEKMTSRMLYMEPDVTSESHTSKKGQFHDPILVASIDIGNTYTRYAFSFRSQYRKDPTDIWMLSDLCSTELSIDNPTMILMDDNKVFDSFGYDALDKYMEHRQGHLFRDIKLPFYHKLTAKDIQNVHVKDELGKQIPAVEVYQAIINRVKDHLQAEQNRKNTGIRPGDIYWVISVPAVFTDRAVTLIETAAIQSGIAKNKLYISIEPVSALEYCTITHKYEQEDCTIHRPSGLTSSKADMFQNGRQYMITDIGGKSLDITVLQKGLSGNVTEQHKVCFVGLGGNSIQEALDNVLIDIVGNEAYHRFRTEEDSRHGYRKLHKNFNERLTHESSHLKSVITVTLPELILIDLESEDSFKTALGKSPYAGEISVVRNKLRLSAALMKGLVAEYCLTLVKQLKDVFEKYSCDKNICLLFVGGYSGVKIVQEALIKEFDNFDIFIPSKPACATAAGSVMLGHIPPLTIDRVPNGRNTIVMREDDQSKASDCEKDDQAIASDFVRSVSEMSISSDFIEDKTITRSSKIRTGLKSLSQRLQGRPQEISVRRNYITTDVITAYGDIDVSRPLKACFADEGDSDKTKEMFGLFWEKICSVWFRGENATIPLVPVAKRAEARRVFPILGKILEHTLCILGHFPPILCRSLVLALAHPDQDVDADLVLNDYLLFVPKRESTLLLKSLKDHIWSENRKKRLARFLV